MIKRVLSLGIVLWYTAMAFGQSASEIKDDHRYLWGEGKGSTLKKADSEALSDLINQISTTVESNFTLLQQEKGLDNFSETFQSVIHTYSSATLNNTERLVIGDEPDICVLRYMLRSEVERVFSARKNKILEYADAGEKAEMNGQIADALRYYYWSQTLLRSHPEGEIITKKDADGKDHLLCTWIPLRINTLFAGLNVRIIGIEQDGNLQRLELAITYNGMAVRNFDYTYWDGRDWSNIVSAKDGRGIVELPQIVSNNEVRLKGEYIFEGEALVDAELKEVLERLDIVPYRSCYLTVSRQQYQSKHSTWQKMRSEAQSVWREEDKEVIASFFHPLTDSSDYLSVIKQVEKAIRDRNYESVRSCFTEEGWEMFSKLISYGQAKVYGSPVYQMIQSGNDRMCRSMPLSFHFPGNNRTFLEDVVFGFSEDMKINSLSFGLSKEALNDIVNKSMWNEHSRMTLIRFLENYKTAYALKRLDYIESIFADDALIIVGSILKRQATNDRQQVTLNKQVVRYTRQTKEQYIKRLKNVFFSNEFVNLRFADNQIRKSGQSEIYGIQIRQDYFSSSYGDTGYLFLMVDLNKPEVPIIHVRAWQPEKDPDFGLIDLSHFTIN